MAIDTVNPETLGFGDNGIWGQRRFLEIVAEYRDGTGQVGGLRELEIS
ncbi:hypothetical protein [Baaleninema sp.]